MHDRREAEINGGDGVLHSLPKRLPNVIAPKPKDERLPDENDHGMLRESLVSQRREGGYVHTL